jgi:endoglucanase Acf2
LVLAAAIIIATLWLVARHSRMTQQTHANRTLVNQASLNALPHKSASSADTSHLENGVLPPTNSWFSGMVLQVVPQAVYPLPLSFKPSSSGFELGLPTITSSATEMDGQHSPGIQVSIEGATGFKLHRYDKLSATLDYQQNSQPLGALTVAEGSPFVFYHAGRTTTLSLPLNPADVMAHDDHYVRYRSNNQIYAVFGQHGTLKLARAGLSIEAPANSDVTFYALPPSSQNDALHSYAGNVVQSVTVKHRQVGETVQTIFQYHTANGQPTVQASLPYQNNSARTLVTYPSVYGPLNAQVGNTFTISVPSVQPRDSLDLQRLTPAQTTQLKSQLAADVAATNISGQDSYFAGKQLARAANLLDIAEQLQQTSLANKLKTELTQAFAIRLRPQYWYYDTKLHGVAAATTGFGSEDFNDHHFHYGYWLYAAAVLAKYDDSFKNRYQNQLDLLAADIASFQPSSQFPETRNYDPYAGHSWAAGLSPFADGNNQESSSEAMHAWNGVALWGHAIGNTDLQQTGEWMLANETNAAAAAWRVIDTTPAGLKNYTAPVVGINFGGKRVYSTFFSDQPSAKLGIQLIPLDPSMTVLASDKQRIHSNVAASITGSNFNVPLGDYDLMYLALSDPVRALSLANQQTSIDDGNSKTYFYAWLFAQADRSK